MRYSADKIICVTNRQLCQDDFLERIQQIASQSLKAIILREKDMTEQAYEQLARQVLLITAKSKTEVILHSYPGVARRLKLHSIHMPISVLRAYAQKSPDYRQWFHTIGVSVHSMEQANEACMLGATYLTVGHIFATDCKRGLPPKGLAFLQNICQHFAVPVYAIGGINPTNAAGCLKVGAKGVCMMSGFMECENPEEYLMHVSIY